MQRARRRVRETVDKEMEIEGEIEMRKWVEEEKRGEKKLLDVILGANKWYLLVWIYKVPARSF